MRRATYSDISSCRRNAFTLAEMLVSIAILVLLVLLVTRLINSASTIATLGNKHINTDNQARPVLDRMAEDFGQIVKRSDVDYFLKQPGNTQPVNDQIAFYSQVEGYYPTSSQSHMSLVSYRVNNDSASSSYLKLQRMGKALIWNGATPASSATPTPAPIVFSPMTILGVWPNATSATAADADYETIGPQVFRFEYYYQLQDCTFSATPWITPTHSAINGLQDVAAIIVTIAVIDPKSRVLVSNAQLTNLANKMSDYPSTQYDLQTQWLNEVNTEAAPPNPTIPTAAAGIHVYQRTLYLNGQSQSQCP
jgi:prepilin-type N-terminal cleavage/methylation domain-containing protein